MPRHSWRSAARALGLATTLALTLPALTGPADATATPAAAATAAAAGPPVSLWAPQRVTASNYSGRVWGDLGLRLVAQGAPFELWSTRASYDDPIRTVWRTGAGDVALPEGSMTDFTGLHRFLSVELTPRTAGGAPVTLHKAACFNGWSERVRPDAPATSPYPRGCWYNPYTLGSVQGIQEGWAGPLISMEGPLRIPVGTYDVTASIAPRYADVFGLTAAEASRSFELVVQRDDAGAYRTGIRAPVDQTPAPAEPTGHPPRQVASGTATGPVPDLRSLPAWGIKMARNGNYLQFSATVWNGGDSPLVVDGFRRDGEDEMDAYQYFFDGDGNQTGYQQVGQLHWDPRPTHQHWHFEDFARYVLLDADQTEAVRSRKEAFCLANTDAVDQTVPNAAWNPENTDLATSCGDHNSLSIREVLASGWGDTYAQFRAGQSFDLHGLPNGTYYIAVMANPDHRLVESSTDNNVSLRKVLIRGTEGHRTVTVPQVGIIEEPDPTHR